MQFIGAFNTERTNLWHKRGKFLKEKNMWLMTSDDLPESHRWHQIYTLNCTKVLGKLACLVLSKVLGSGSAERMFKIQKLMSRGQRAGLSMARSKKQGLVYSRYQEMKCRNRVKKLSVAGVLWEDNDFESCKLDEYCHETEQGTVVNGDGEIVRVFRA